MKLKWYLVKLGLSLLILALILNYVDLGQVWSAFKAFPLVVVTGVAVGYVLGQFLSAYKWMLLVNSTGAQPGYFASARAYFIGIFVNFFGLGMVGGDVARGVLVARRAEKREAVLLTVVADRAHGLLVLLLLWLLAALLFGAAQFDQSLLLLFIGLFVAGLLCWFVASRWFGKFAQSSHPIVRKLSAVAYAFPAEPKLLFSITAISLVFHLSQIALHYLMFWGLNLEISFSYLLLAVPVVNILSSLPITWNGVGVRESGYLFFFTELQMIATDEQALAFGLLWLVAVTFSSALGGLIILLGAGKPLQEVAKLEENAPLESPLEAPPLTGR